jgi:hypothetical protein
MPSFCNGIRHAVGLLLKGIVGFAKHRFALQGGGFAKKTFGCFALKKWRCAGCRRRGLGLVGVCFHDCKLGSPKISNRQKTCVV